MVSKNLRWHALVILAIVASNVVTYFVATYAKDIPDYVVFVDETTAPEMSFSERDRCAYVAVVIEDSLVSKNTTEHRQWAQSLVSNKDASRWRYYQTKRYVGFTAIVFEVVPSYQTAQTQ